MGNTSVQNNLKLEFEKEFPQIRNDEYSIEEFPRSWWDGDRKFILCWINYLKIRFPNLITDFSIIVSIDENNLTEYIPPFLLTIGKKVEIIVSNGYEEYFKYQMNYYDKIDPMREKEWVVILTGVKTEESHLNSMFLNRKTGIIEYFEPHGSQFTNKELESLSFYNFIEEWFLKNWNNGFKKFQQPSKLCFRGIGLQQNLDRLAEYGTKSGHCVAFNMLYLHLRLLFPNISFNKLTEWMLNPENIQHIKPLLFTYFNYIHFYCEQGSNPKLNLDQNMKETIDFENLLKCSDEICFQLKVLNEKETKLRPITFENVVNQLNIFIKKQRDVFMEIISNHLYLIHQPSIRFTSNSKELKENGCLTITKIIKDEDDIDFTKTLLKYDIRKLLNFIKSENNGVPVYIYFMNLIDTIVYLKDFFRKEDFNLPLLILIFIELNLKKPNFWGLVGYQKFRQIEPIKEETEQNYIIWKDSISQIMNESFTFQKYYLYPEALNNCVRLLFKTQNDQVKTVFELLYLYANSIEEQCKILLNSDKWFMLKPQVRWPVIMTQVFDPSNLLYSKTFEPLIENGSEYLFGF